MFIRSIPKYTWRDGIRPLFSIVKGTKELAIEQLPGKVFFTLNREKFGNAVNLDMIDKLNRVLDQCLHDKDVHAIIFKAVGDTFCSGITNEDPKLLEDTIKSYSLMQHKLVLTKKPNTSILDGKIIGSASSLAFDHMHRIGTERATFCMEEASNVLLPDCRSVRILPTNLGLYLAITGHCLNGKQLYDVGLVNHIISSNKLEALERDIRNFQDLDSVIHGIARYRKFGGNYALEALDYFYKIDMLFSVNKTLDEIYYSLVKRDTEWSKKQLQLIRRKPPLNRKVTLELYKQLEGKPLNDAIQLQYGVMKKFAQAMNESDKSGHSDRTVNAAEWERQMSSIQSEEIMKFFEQDGIDKLVLD